MRMLKVAGVVGACLAAVLGTAALLAVRCDRAVKAAKAMRTANAVAAGLSEAGGADPWYGIRLGDDSARAGALLTRLGFEVKDGFREEGSDTIVISARREFGERILGRLAYDEWLMLTSKPGGSIVAMSCLQAELGGRWRRLSVPEGWPGTPESRGEWMGPVPR